MNVAIMGGGTRGNEIARIAMDSNATVQLITKTTEIPATGIVVLTSGDTALVTGDDHADKRAFIADLEAGGIGAVDAGPLATAEELEGMGALDLSISAAEALISAKGYTRAS